MCVAEIKGNIIYCSLLSEPVDYAHSCCNLVCGSRIVFLTDFWAGYLVFEHLIMGTEVADIRGIKVAAELSKPQSITIFYCQSTLDCLWVNLAHPGRICGSVQVKFM